MLFKIIFSLARVRLQEIGMVSEKNLYGNYIAGDLNTQGDEYVTLEEN